MLLQFFYEAASAFVLDSVEHLPLALHSVVGLELRPGLGAFDTVLDAAPVEMLHEYAIDTAPAKLRLYRDQEQIEGVVLLERAEHSDPAGREESASALLHRLSHRWGADRETHEVVIVVHQQAAEIRIDQWQELVDILVYLPLVQLYRAVKVSVRDIDEIEGLAHIRFDVGSLAHIHLVVARAVEHRVGDPL